MGFAALYPSYKMPDGQISIFCQVLRKKKSCLPSWGKSVAFLRASHPNEGRLAIVTKRAVGCGGRGCAFDEGR
jgi:hypothetical protein